jgi:hypothetical protein
LLHKAQRSPDAPVQAAGGMRASDQALIVIGTQFCCAAISGITM